MASTSLSPSPAAPQFSTRYNVLMRAPTSAHPNLGRKFAFAPRRKRHVRSPRSNFEITPGDVALLAQVVRFRLLSAPQAEALDPRHTDVVRRRLRDLYDHGYLDRPKAELARLFRMRNAPGIYVITNRGARLLRETNALIPALARRRVDWWTKNARLSDVAFIEHTLKITDAVLAFARSAERHGLTMLDQHQLLTDMPEATLELPLPFRLQAVIDADDRNHNGTPRARGVTPDRLLSFVTADGERINVALEIDNGTLPELRSSLDQSSNIRKVAVYHAAQRDGLIREQWGFKQFFVTLITTTSARERSMYEAQRAYLDDKGSRMFLFADQATFAAGDPLASIWRNGRGERETLLRLPHARDAEVRPTP